MENRPASPCKDHKIWIVCHYMNTVQWDPVYLDPKDLEHSFYQTALVSTQVCKTNFGADIITYTASLLCRFWMF